MVLHQHQSSTDRLNFYLTGLAAAPAVIKINYLNFDDAITNKYGIVVRSWPLKEFKCPGKINSLPDLQVLYNAWNNGLTTFYKMSLPELEEWDGLLLVSIF